MLLPAKCQAMATIITAGKSAILITGATDGIGRTTARTIVVQSLGSNNQPMVVLVHGRDPERIRQTMQELGQLEETNHHNVAAVALAPTDLSSMAACRDLAAKVRAVCTERQLSLSTLLNNAGVFSEQLCRTNDGLERTFAVNVVAPFVLTSLLLDLIQDRIVIASSISQCRSIRDWDDLHYQKRSYSAHAAYSESKLMDAMLTMEIADRLTKKGIAKPTCNCLDPGTVNTKMLLAGWGNIGIDVNSALDETWLCTSPEVADVTGQYFVHRSSSRASASAYDPTERQKLWKILSDLAPDAASVWNS